MIGDPGPKLPTPDYERGYRDGESNNAADWELALMDVLPEEIDVRPSQVATYVRSLQQHSSPDDGNGTLEPAP